MRHLVIGMGEVGNGVFSSLRDRYEVLARDADPVIISLKIDVLHIAIPYNDRFETSIGEYIELYNPSLTIVYSTVPIGTCERLDVVHSPVEGRHPHIGLSILSSPRWLGTSNERLMQLAANVWEKITPLRKLPSANFTEWLKLRSTSKYGVSLVWADYEARVSKELGMDFSAIKLFDMDYNKLYERLGLPQFQRYILDEPNGHIGGHCVVPNAELLDNQYPNDMLKAIQGMK